MLLNCVLRHCFWSLYHFHIRPLLLGDWVNIRLNYIRYTYAVFLSNIFLDFRGSSSYHLYWYFGYIKSCINVLTTISIYVTKMNSGKRKVVTHSPRCPLKKKTPVKNRWLDFIKLATQLLFINTRLYETGQESITVFETSRSRKETKFFGNDKKLLQFCCAYPIHQQTTKSTITLKTTTLLTNRPTNEIKKKIEE